ncbi:universal stress protein [Halioxenophilus aromaticivorans]|uniref:Universal stress protein UspE n=1 Tax=Halioxenophilus aromaticivorans TaxID=1306992 RepID=A0AAV3U430_9ALTE
MAESKKIFVVVDPSHSKHIALERAIKTAQLAEQPPVVKVFVAVDADAVDTRAVNNNLFRDQSWFSAEIRTPLENAGVEYSLEVCWSSEWQESIARAAKPFHPDLIYLPVHERGSSTRLFFTESKWKLLKNAECPVALIQPGAKEKREIILAAVNFQATKDEQIKLNQSIIGAGERLAGYYGAELHIVNAYLDSMHYPDRGRLAKESGVPPERIHVEEGYTNEAVAALAKRLGADLVIIGTLNQKGLTATRRGNTAERVISALDQDVVVVNY